MATESLIDFDAVVADKPPVKKPVSSLINFDEIVGSSSGEPAKAASSVPVTQAGTFARSYGEAAAATPGALLGARAGFALTPPVLPIVGPFAKPIGGIAGALIGGVASSLGINSLEQMVDNVFGTNIIKTKEEQQKQFPGTALAGQVVGGGLNPFMRPGLAGSAGQMAVGAGVMTGVGVGMRAAEGGNVFGLKEMGADIVSGAFTRPTARGQRLLGQTPSTPIKKEPPLETPVRPPEGASDAEKQTFIDKIKANIAERDANSPLVQTAIRNKATGEVELMGPKHDQKRLLETADTHDQGFVDERNNFLTRQEAADRVVTTKQVPSEEYVSKEVDTPSQTEEIITQKIEILEKKLADAERSDAYNLARDAREELVVLKRRLKLVQEYGPTPVTYKNVTKTRAKLELPEEGLYSRELRAAGDERFAVTEEQPAGVPKPPVEPTAPITREDFKTLIAEKELRQGVDLEYALIEARRSGTPEEIATLEAEDARLTAEIQQLRKDIPAVKFADINNPTWEEFQDSLWGAKKVGQAFDRIISNNIGTPQEQLLAKLLNKSQFIRNATLQLEPNYLEYVDSQGRTRKDAAGIYVGEDTHAVTLGKEGDVSTLLHEAIHAATVRLLYEGNSVAAKKLTQLHKEFLTKHEAEYQLKLKEFRAASPNRILTVKELSDFRKENKGDYGLTNVREFVAEAFTNKKFQELLASIESKEPSSGVTSNLWEAFKNYVREGLNIPPGKRTAFDDVMDSGITLIDESKQFSRFDAPSDAYLKGVAADPSVRGPLTEPTSVKETVDEDGVITKTPIVDTTKPDPRDVKTRQELEQIATDIYEKHGEVEAVKFFEGYKAYQKTLLEPIKTTENFIGTYLNQKVATERIVHNNAADIKEMAGKDVNLEQLTYDIDKGVTLTGKAKEVADKFRSLMDELGKRALDNDVIRGWHENYVARNVVTEGAAPPGAVKELLQELFGSGGKSADSKSVTKYGEPRRLKTREDLLRHLDGINSWLDSKGADYRFKIKTDNLAEIYKDYALAVEKTIENKKLIDNLVHIKNDAGESLIRPITPEEPKPYSWKTMDNSQLDGYAVHPDLMPHLRFVFDAGPGKLMQAFGSLSQFVKRFNVIGSFFHAKSLMEAQSSAQIPIWSPLKESVVLPIAEKLIKGTTGKELQLSAISKAIEQFRRGGAGDNVDTWIKTGLGFELPEDVSRNVLATVGKFADSMIGKYGPKTRVLESSMTTVEKYTLQQFDKYTWDYLHTGLKLSIADAYLDRARMDAAKAGKAFDEMASRVEISKFINNSFGGLNWYDIARQTQNEFAKRMALAAYSPAGRRALQVILFAPDWTISTIRAFTAALPKGLNPTKWNPVAGIKGMKTPTTEADYARLYQFKTVLTALTLINGINLLTADRPIWENKDPTRIEFPDGTSMQAMKHAMEPYHWIADPVKTLSNKLGFIPKSTIIALAGTEYASPNAPKLLDPSVYGKGKAILQGMAPFQVSAAISAPKGEGVKRAVLGTIGLPLYGATSEQRKLARQERTLVERENALKYHEDEIKAGREKRTEEHQKRGRMLREQRRKFELEKAKE
jgi:hypothetical protein